MKFSRKYSNFLKEINNRFIRKRKLWVLLNQTINGGANFGSFSFLRMVATSIKTGMIIPALHQRRPLPHSFASQRSQHISDPN